MLVYHRIEQNPATAAIIVNYNMPERAESLAEHIKHNCLHCDLYLVDNGSDIVDPAPSTNVWISQNKQTTGGWLEGLAAADRSGNDYFAYWFLITSAEFMPEAGDVLSPMIELLQSDHNTVGVHPALTPDSTTSWAHLYDRGSGVPRRTWMIDNIASVYRADWFNSIGRFDASMIYGWGIDLETCFKARQQARSLWVDERVKVKKITDIGYTMKRMNMSADERQRLAGLNMRQVLKRRYGGDWWELMTKARVRDDWM